MTSIKTEGIVLRRYNYSETSLLVYFFTERLGKVKTLVKGAKKPKGRFFGRLELASILDLVIHQGARTDLHVLADVSLLDSLEPLRTDLAKFAHAMVILELVDAAFEVESPNATFYGDLSHGLHLLCNAPMDPWIALVIHLKMLHALGLLPADNFCQECGKPFDGSFYFSSQHGASLCRGCLPKGTSAVLSQGWQIPYLAKVVSRSLDDCVRLPITEAQKRQFYGWARNMLDGVVHKKIRSYDFLSQVGFSYS